MIQAFSIAYGVNLKYGVVVSTIVTAGATPQSYPSRVMRRGFDAAGTQDAWTAYGFLQQIIYNCLLVIIQTQNKSMRT